MLEPIKVTFYCAKFGSHRHSSSKYKIVFVFQDHVIKVLNDFMARSPSKYFTILPSLVAIGTVAVEL